MKLACNGIADDMVNLVALHIGHTHLLVKAIDVGRQHVLIVYVLRVEAGLLRYSAGLCVVDPTECEHSGGQPQQEPNYACQRSEPAQFDDVLAYAAPEAYETGDQNGHRDNGENQADSSPAQLVLYKMSSLSNLQQQTFEFLPARLRHHLRCLLRNSGALLGIKLLQSPEYD